MEEQPESRPRRPVTRLTWLLLLLLAAVGLMAGTIKPLQRGPADGAPQYTAGSVPTAPEVVEATGPLAEVFHASRSAVVRVESRCVGPMFGRSAIDVGSGFFISPQGHVLTAYHVVRRQALGEHAGCRLEHVAVDAQQREYRLKLVGFDAYQDLALLQAQTSEPVPFLPLATTTPAVGSEVVAIGNSRGEFLEDRAGKVSRLDVSAVEPAFASGTIEMTAAVAPGDSGGPVIDLSGEVVGVVSYISFEPALLAAERNTPWAGLLGNVRPEFASYAVPVRDGSDAMGALLAGERVDIPVIGFEMAFEYHPRAGRSPRLGKRAGVVVGRVQPDGPGAAAGLRSLQQRTIRDDNGEVVGMDVRGDVIVAVDGTPTPSFNTLLEAVRGKGVGEKVTLTVQRENSIMQMELVLAGYRQVFN